MMTPDEILALPTAQLPRALYEAGLAPADVSLSDACILWRRPPTQHVPVIYSSEALWYRLEDMPTQWRPHERWDHAALLLERFKMILQPAAVRGTVLWCVESLYEPYMQEQTFAELPAAICRIALLVQAAQGSRTQEATP